MLFQVNISDPEIEEERGPVVDLFRQLAKAVISFPGQAAKGISRMAGAGLIQPPSFGGGGLGEASRLKAENVVLPQQLTEEELAQDPLFAAGQRQVESVEKRIPGGPEGFAGQVGAGIGSTVGFLGSAVLGPAGPLLAGAALTAEDLAEQATASGADESTIEQATQFGAALGLSEALPLGALLGRLNRFSGGGVKRVVVEALKQGGEEASQEVLQQLGSNATALGLFDENRDLLEGALESGGVGLVVGMLFGGVGGAAVSGMGIKEAEDLLSEGELLQTGTVLPSEEELTPERLEQEGGLIGVKEGLVTQKEREVERRIVEEPELGEAGRLLEGELEKPFEEQDLETIESAVQVLRGGEPLVGEKSTVLSFSSMMGRGNLLEGRLAGEESILRSFLSIPFVSFSSTKDALSKAEKDEAPILSPQLLERFPELSESREAFLKGDISPEEYSKEITSKALIVGKTLDKELSGAVGFFDKEDGQTVYIVNREPDPKGRALGEWRVSPIFNGEAGESRHFSSRAEALAYGALLGEVGSEEDIGNTVLVMAGRDPQLTKESTIRVPSLQAPALAEAVVSSTQPEDLSQVLGLANAPRRVLEERFGVTSRKMPVEDLRTVSSSIQRATAKLAADPLVASGSTTLEDRAEQEAVSLAEEVNKNLKGVFTSDRNLLLTDAEHGLMLLGAARIAGRREALSLELDVAIETDTQTGAEAKRREIFGLDAKLEEIFTAVDIAGTELSAAFRARQAWVDVLDLTPAGSLRDARLMKGEVLTTEESEKVLSKQRLHDAAKADLEGVMQKTDLKLLEKEKVAAELEFRSVSRQKIKAEQLALLLEEREAIKANLQALGFRVNDVTGLSAEALWELGKLARNYIKEGKLQSIDQVVDQIREDAPVFRDLDIYQALNAKNPKAKKKLRSNLLHINMQARRLKKVESVAGRLAKKEGVTSKDLRGFNSNVAALKDAILQDPTATTEEMSNMLKGLEEVQDAVRGGDFERSDIGLSIVSRIFSFQEKTADINDQLETGDYRIKPDPEEVVTAFDKELLRAKAEYRRARGNLRREISNLRPFFDPKDTKGRKVAKSLIETTRFSRQTLVLDLISALLRQGLFGIVMPGKFAETSVQGFKSFFSEVTAESVAVLIEEDPDKFELDQMGIDFTEIGGLPSRTEEFFGSHIIRNLPRFAEVVAGDAGTFGQMKLAAAGLRELSGAAERSYTTLLNLIRLHFGKRFLRDYSDATPAQRRSYGRIVNAMTGRGNMKASTAAALSIGIFAPRFAYSRFETLGRLVGATGDVAIGAMKKAVGKGELNPASKRITGDMAKFFGLMLGTHALIAFANAAGIFDEEDVTVGLDPESSDFGKIIVDNTRYDLWGGLQQYVSLGLRVSLATLDKRGLREAVQNANPYDLGLRATLYKTSPAVTLPTAILFGETVVGERVNFGEAVYQSFIPLFIQDFGEALEKEGLGAGIAAGSAASLGVGVSTFGDEMKSGDMVKLLSRARIGVPSAPRYRKPIREDLKTKDSLDAAYEALLAQRLRLRKRRLDLLSPVRRRPDEPSPLEEAIRDQATIVRRKFRRYGESSLSRRIPSEAEVESLVPNQ